MIPELSCIVNTESSHQEPAVSPDTTDITCPRCGSGGPHQIGPGAGPHATRALCRHCGAFIAWLSTRSPAERQARRQARLQAMTQRPPSPLQLAYLVALGDGGPVPASMAEASQRIAALVREEVRV